jgi:hypothetical protein
MNPLLTQMLGESASVEIQASGNHAAPCLQPICIIRSGENVPRKRSELIGSLVVVVPADYTRYQ